jgi:hypothetical protein
MASPHSARGAKLGTIEASSPAEPRAGWRSTVWTARAEIEDILRDSPSLRRQIDAAIIEQTAIAARLAEDGLALHAETVERIRARLRDAGFTAEQVVGDWFPKPSG